MNDSSSIPSAPPKWVRPLSLILFAAGLAALGLVIAAAWRGEAFAIGGVLWVKPTRYLRLAVLGLGAAWVLWSYARGGAKAAGGAFGKLMILALSGGLSVAVAEMGMRSILTKRMATGTFEQFKEMKKRGEKIPVKSASPLAAIITPSENPKLVYELQPNTDMIFGHKTLRINSQGFRSDQVFTKERAANSIRILGIGDSGMFGWGVDQGSNYMDVVARTLNARGDGVTYEALNTGTPGYNTQLEVELLKHRGLEFKPDIVIVGWCENDFFLSHFFLKQTPLPKDHLLVYDFVFDREKFKTVLSGPSIGDRAGTMTKSGEMDFEQIPDNLEKGTGVEGVTTALKELQALGAQHNFKILLFGPMKPDIVRIAKELGMEHVNTLEKVDAAKYPTDFYVHAIHPRDGGHRVLGELIAAELDARGWLKPAK